MKKQTKIIVGVVLGIAALILVLSFLFPSVYKGLTSGSFGKADKYRQEQMSEEDIKLRTEFTKDTASLRQMVTGLIYFSLFTDNLAMTIDTCLVSYKLQGIDKDPANKQIIQLLQDYSTFLTNSNKTIAGTTRMLAAFMLQDTAAYAMDVDKNVRDFAMFVSQVNEKDSVLMQAVTAADKFLVNNKMLQKNTEQVRNLKAIRDQLVIKSVQFMALTNNKKELGSMMNYALSSQGQFSGVEALRVVNANDKIGSLALSRGGEFNSVDKIGMAFSANQFNAGELNSIRAIVIYDKDNLRFDYSSGENLKVVYGAEKLQGVLCGTDPGTGVLGVSYGGNLGVVLNAGVLCNLMQASELNNQISATVLKEIDIEMARDLAGVRAIDANYVGVRASLQMGFCGNANLQSFANSNYSLQNVLQHGAIGSFLQVYNNVLNVVEIP